MSSIEFDRNLVRLGSIYYAGSRGVKNSSPSYVGHFLLPGAKDYNSFISFMFREN